MPLENSTTYLVEYCEATIAVLQQCIRGLALAVGIAQASPIGTVAHVSFERLDRLGSDRGQQ